MDLNQLKQKFIDEAESLLTNLDNVLIELEKDNSNSQYINEAFRVMHTIKGASGMFGFEKVVEITHEIESLYDLVRDQKMKVTTTLLEITFAAADHIRALLVDEMVIKEENKKRHELLFKNINLIKSGTSLPLDSKSIIKNIVAKGNSLITWNILFYPSEDLIVRCINITYTFHDLFLLGEYKISVQPSTSTENQFWSIFLITEKPYEEIEDALMFILDYCKISKVADFNIFDPSFFEKRDDEIKSVENAINTVVITPPIGSEAERDETSNNLLQGMNALKTNTPISNTKIITSRINVDATKLDTLMYLVSELVTTKSELIIALQKQNESKALDAAEKI